MKKEDIFYLFIKKGILSNKTELIRRPFNWKTKFDNEAQQIFLEFAKNYRSDDEAWFCLCRNIELPICPICNINKVKFTGITKNGAKGYNTTCDKCSANQVQAKKDAAKKTCSKRTTEQRKQITEKRKNTNKQKYNDENYMLFGSKSFHDNLENKYGDKNYNNSDQRKSTCLDKYGYTTNLLIPEVHSKAIKNSWSNECRQKRIDNSLMINGVKHHWCLDITKQRAQNTKKQHIHDIELQHNCILLEDVVKQFGQGFKCLDIEYLYINSHVYIQNKDISVITEYFNEGTHTNNYTSKLEKEILTYVKSVYTGTVYENNTSIVPNENHRFFELDIFLPEINLAIDVNGTYWHSTKFKDKYYHQRKTRCCRNAGIHILHIFEDDWKTNTSKCKQLIQESIKGTLSNVIEYKDDILIGDNTLPVFGNYEILKVTEPIYHQLGSLTYYDCGKIYYRTIN